MKTIFNISLLTTFLIVVLSIISCDEVSQPYLQDRGTVGPVDTGFVKKILLEDYTGYACQNCPPAHEIAQELIDVFGDRLVVVTIHVGTFSNPGFAPKGYQYDFRTETGNEWGSVLKTTNTPLGLINRKGSESDRVKTPGEWEQAISDVLDDEPVVSIKLNAEYIAATREISITVDYKYNENITEYHNLNVLIIEDSIVKYQKWVPHDPQDILDYVHNHVLRKSLNGPWGDELTEATSKKEYKYTIPAESDWRPDKLRIVAFISDVGNSYEVLQVEEVSLFDSK